jgi:hypothetical protein
VTLGGSDDTVTLSVRSLGVTTKVQLDASSVIVHQGVYLSVWRRDVTAQGTVAHLVSSRNPADAGAPNGYIKLSSASTIGYVTFEDRMSEALAADNEELYLDLNELPNIPPEASTAIASVNDRVWLSLAVDPNTVVASKERVFGEPLNFANNGIAASCEGGSGPITGLASRGDVLTVFRERSVHEIAGLGPSNVVGDQNTFEPSRLVSGEVGAIGPGSIISTPVGVFFQSRRGIMVYADGLKYIGAPVDGDLGLGSREIVATVMGTSFNEIHFIMSNGESLLYDYAAGQWATYTIGGLHACLWQGLWAVLHDTAGSVSYETLDLFTDNGVAYETVVETGRIQMAGILGLERVRAVYLLGDRSGSGNFTLTLSTEADDGVAVPVDRVIADTEAVWRVYARLPVQKFGTLKISMSDTSGTVLVSFSDLALEIGIGGKSPRRLGTGKQAT